MASKQDKFFFNNLIEAATLSCKAANYLVECLENYDYNNIRDMLDKMHEIEHEADTKKHEMSAALAKSFVTPVDREDLAFISHRIDDVTDNVEDILQRFYMNKITSVLPDAITFVKKIAIACETMKNTVCEFNNFKKPAKLHELIINLNDLEEDCDRFYLEAKSNVRNNCSDILDIIFWREIFDKFEKCADSCENVGDAIDTVVMKNS